MGGVGGVLVEELPKKPGLVAAGDALSSLISDGPAGDGGVLGVVEAAAAAAAAATAAVSRCCAPPTPGGIKSGRMFAAENSRGPAALAGTGVACG